MITETELRDSIVDLKYETIKHSIKAALNNGMQPMTILNSLKQGLDIVGERYHNKQYFLSELFMAGETMSAAMDVLTPALAKNQESEPTAAGKVILGSIQGDVHDFGKNIAKIFLIASGFIVQDLGVDIAPSKFVDEAVSMDADIIGISAILSATQPTSQAVIQELLNRGLREQFKVILGGTGVTKRAITEYGVDEAVNDATEGVNIIKKWMESEEK
jgi:methanogenic corrinoid protein MtbC1